VACLKTPDNSPDAALTPLSHDRGGQDLRVPATIEVVPMVKTRENVTAPIKWYLYVYVTNMRGEPLMPCSPRKARLLVRQGNACIVRRNPFTLQLTYATGETTQPLRLGVDGGYTTAGLSAVTEKREVFAAEVQLREDMVKLNAERRQYRRARRGRKTWYRKPRFLNRCKPEGWLAPSLQHKLDSHEKLVTLVKGFLPISQQRIEMGAFDIHQLKNPQIGRVDYQEGDQKGFWNVRAYGLYQDGHVCQQCKGKAKDPVLEVHHIVSRQIGGDRPDNLITLCKTCHAKLTKGELRLKVRPAKGYKAETFMTTIRWKLVDHLRAKGEEVSHTYGYLTKSMRIALDLEKSHINDAFVIAGGTTQKRSVRYRITQVRNCNRKLHRGARSQLPNTASRYLHGFQRYDKVLWKGPSGKEQGIECFIVGRRTTGYFALRTLDGTKIHDSAHYSDLTLLESATTFLIERIDT
jgi:5-methylcytosine-specific restriction endonuclease McrA